MPPGHLQVSSRTVSLHRLQAGQIVIDGLVKLASAFGYSAEREFPVGTRATSAAVDVAWFAAGDQRVPLMIFEVESSASASMANNAMKVFSQVWTIS